MSEALWSELRSATSTASRVGANLYLNAPVWAKSSPCAPSSSGCSWVRRGKGGPPRAGRRASR
eukprot:9624221-Alexandrium_andersonii.AAC.1